MGAIAIKLRKLFNTPILRDREAARSLVRLLESKSTKKVELDFSEIEFVSLSFSHELQSYLKTNPQVECTNRNEEVRRMMLASQARPPHVDLPRVQLVKSFC